MAASSYRDAGPTLLPDASRHGASVALVDAESGAAWTYARLEEATAQVATNLASSHKGVVAWVSRSTAPGVAAYLGALASGHAVLPIPARLNDSLLARIVDAYRPDTMLVLQGERLPDSILAAYRRERLHGSAGMEEELVVWRRMTTAEGAVHPELCLLLSTSGSTGSPKMVRLTRGNVRSNAVAIVDALGIDANECAASSLPLFYSYGLSVLHSHLVAGARLVLTERSVMEPEMWDALTRHQCTSLAAVPYMYGMLQRIGFEERAPASLRTLTQAGGKLSLDLITRFADIMHERGGRMFVMYGQTEATARITVLPPHLLAAKRGSVGLPLRGGRLVIRPVEGGEEGATGGEIIYHGPNVMMGYAESRQDLHRGDELRGVLETGDLGSIDADGCLFVTGRQKRFAKVFGLRVSLDELESRLASSGPVAVTGRDDTVSVFTVASRLEAVRSALAELAHETRLHPSAFQLSALPELPVLPNGKIDYASLTKEASRR